MNFKNPQVDKVNKRPPSKFQEVVQKISAGLGLLQMGGGAMMPKVNNKIISGLLIFIIYIFVMGIFSTGYWIVQLVKYIF